MIPFCNKSKPNKKSLKVKIFFNLLGTYKEGSQVADIITTEGIVGRFCNFPQV